MPETIDQLATKTCPICNIKQAVNNRGWIVEHLRLDWPCYPDERLARGR